MAVAFSIVWGVIMASLVMWVVTRGDGDADQ